MLVSICIPCYNAENNIETVVNGITGVFAGTEYDYQIVLVNDFSRDKTFEVIESLVEKNPKIIGVDLSRNYGQSSAKMAALSYADGDVVVFMDDDGQHPVEGIMQLVDKVLEGNDIVYAHFVSKDQNLARLSMGNLHHKMQVKLGNTPEGIHASAFFAWSKLVADAMKENVNPIIAFEAYQIRITSKYAEVEMKQEKRLSGQSGYNLKKLFEMWANSFFSYSLIPLRISTAVGGSAAVIAFIVAIVTLIRKLIDPTIALGYSSLLIAILGVGGLILLALGIIGEYIGRIYITISNIPQYKVRRVVINNK